MKILVIPTTDWTGHPVPNRLNFIFDRIARRHSVDVCHFKIFPEALRETRCDLIPMDDGECRDVRTYYPMNILKHWKRIKSISHGYDIILSANILPGLVTTLRDTPTVVDYMDLFPDSAAAYYSPPMDQVVRKVASFACRYNLERSVGVITTTPSFGKYLRDRISTPVQVIPNGLDTHVMRPVDGGIKEELGLGYPVIGYVGSLESWIDLEFAIQVFPRILEIYPDASLLIVGPSLHTDYADSLKHMVKDKGLERCVTFTGRVPYQQLAPYISAMDVGLNPRKPWKMNTLTMGGKVLSYLACGVPVVSKNMPVVEKEFVDKGVFTYDDIEGFVETIGKALDSSVDPDTVKDYDWDVISLKYEEVLKGYR